MKKLLFILALLLVAFAASAQTFSSDIVTNGWRNNSTFKLGTDNPLRNGLGDYTIPLNLRTPALQLTFTQIEKVGDAWKLTTPIYIGYSYIFSYANGIVHQDSSITVESKLFFGGGVNFGVTPDLENGGELVGSIPVGAVVGYSRYGAFIGYDVINKKPLLGVSINLLNVPILQSLTRFSVRETN